MWAGNQCANSRNNVHSVSECCDGGMVLCSSKLQYLVSLCLLICLIFQLFVFNGNSSYRGGYLSIFPERPSLPCTHGGQVQLLLPPFWKADSRSGSGVAG